MSEEGRRAWARPEPGGEAGAEPPGGEGEAPDSRYLAPAEFVDSDHPEVRAYAERAAGGGATPRERAVRLFYAVRDGIRYDPYGVSPERDAYRASRVLHQERAFCVPKAVLLTACARALGIPARLGFADVRNHLTSPKLRARMGTDLFVFHGFAELWIEGRWVKATPAFDRGLCERFAVMPLEFDGRTDAVFQPFDRHGRRHLEYVRDRGSYADLPFEEMIRTLRQTYGGSLLARTGAASEDPLFRPGVPASDPR